MSLKAMLQQGMDVCCYVFSWNHREELEIETICIWQQGALDQGVADGGLVLAVGNGENLLTESAAELLGKHRCAVVFDCRDWETIPRCVGSLEHFTRWGIPVLVLHEGVSFTRLLQVCNGIFQRRAAQVSHAVLRAGQALLSATLFPERGGLCQVASQLLGCEVALTTPDFELLLEGRPVAIHTEDQNPFRVSGDFDWIAVLQDFRRANTAQEQGTFTDMDGRPFPSYRFQNAYCRQRGRTLLLLPLKQDGTCFGHAVFCVEAGFSGWSATAMAQIQQFVIFATFEIFRSEDLARTVNKYYDFVLDELLESELTDFRRLMQKYGLADKRVVDSYYVFIAGRRHLEDHYGMYYELLVSQNFNSLYNRIRNQIRATEFFLFERRDSLVLFVAEELVASHPQLPLELEQLFREVCGDAFEGCGLSDAVSTVRVRDGYFQARNALSLSRNSHSKKLCRYNELGILRYFCDKKDQIDLSALREVYDTFIKSVLDYDWQHKTQLAATLMCYMEHNLSPSAACRELYIHKNTLYARLSKVSELIGMRVNSSEAIFNIQLALKLHALVESGLISM